MASLALPHRPFRGRRGSAFAPQRRKRISLLPQVLPVPPGATRVSEAEAARHPAEPDRAIAIVSELRSNAALFAAFAFGALSLPTTLVISESRVTSTTSSR